MDTSSAEWIAEAPSACDDVRGCQTLPLADFGTATFANATATSVFRHTGPIADPAWPSTALTLATRGRPLGGMRFTDDATRAAATPSPLSETGDGFTVTSGGRAG